MVYALLFIAVQAYQSIDFRPRGRRCIAPATIESSGTRPRVTFLPCPRSHVTCPQFIELVGDANLQPAPHRLVEAVFLHAVRQIALTGGKAIVFIVRVTVTLAIV